MIFIYYGQALRSLTSRAGHLFHCSSKVVNKETDPLSLLWTAAKHGNLAQ